MSQHTKRRVKLFEMHCFKMFIIALCVIFFILRIATAQKLEEKSVVIHRYVCLHTDQQ